MGRLTGRSVVAGAFVALVVAMQPSTTAAQELLVADSLTDSVRRYDPATGAFLGTFASGGGLDAPFGLAYGPDGNLYVSSFVTNKILKYSRATGTFLGEFASVSRPYDLALGSDGDLYVQSDVGGISRFDGSSGAALGVVIPSPGTANSSFFSMAIGPDDVMYIGGPVIDHTSGSISRYNYHTGAFLGEFATGFDGNGPRQAIWDANGDLLSADLNDGVVRKFNGTTGASLGVFADPPSNGNVAIVETAGYLFVSGVWTEAIYRHNATTGAYVDTLVSGVASGAMLVRPAPVCGNGFIDAGELCDDGDATGSDGCSATCQTENGWNCSGTPSVCTTTCGDTITAGAEECDDGNTAGGDGCSATCHIEGCPGSLTGTWSGGPTGFPYISNVIDDGMGTVHSVSYIPPVLESAATLHLTQTRSGNTLTAPGLVGTVDNCNQVTYVSQTDGLFVATRTSTTACGNGSQEAGEFCDDNNLLDNDTCNIACTAPACGNGSREPGETCDDGNTVNGDGCSAVCQMETGCAGGLSGTWTGILYGITFQWNLVDNGTSQVTGSYFAQGLPFNSIAGSGPATMVRSGNSIAFVDTGTIATCDTITFNGPSLPAFTMTRVGRQVCGNGTREAGEFCDDGNFANNDACNLACGAPQCGNASLEPGEACDDGNTVNNDACTAACTVNVCGDGVRNEVLAPGYEGCDDGNLVDGDGCDSNCFPTVCGNGIITAGEDCDDGSPFSPTPQNGDGCSSTCHFEVGWVCSGEPSACERVFAVNSTADAVDATPGDGVCASASNECTLRAAIMEANAVAGHNSITLPAGTYTLTIAPTGTDTPDSGDLDIAGDTDISGHAASDTIIDGNGLDRVLHINAAATVRNVTVRNGLAPSGAYNIGGGIWVATGSLLLDHALVSGNTADNGGGIFNSATLTVRDTAVRGNHANTFSGGVGNSGTATLDRLEVSGNSAVLAAAGVGNGSVDRPATLTVINSTISGNTSAGGAGGLGNSRVPDNGPFANDVHLRNVTITNNSAGANGAGGLGTLYGTVTIGNSIIAGNTVSGSIAPDCGGVLTSEGYNVIQNTLHCTLSGNTTGNLTGVSPNLGSLADNGGPTRTHQLLVGSPALEAGSPATPGSGGGACEAVDQRGIARPQGTRCDIGALEAKPCGNGVVDADEQCDDGNIANGDGCSDQCLLEPEAIATLVKDINPSFVIMSSNPQSFVTIGTVTFFVASTSATGQELWKTDGTSGGTVLVKDIRPGAFGSFPSSLVNAGGTLFFIADDGTSGVELWKSDGSAAGTVLVKDLRPGPAGGLAPSLNGITITSELTSMGAAVFFAADDGVSGSEPWKSDGTAAGTVLLKNINTEPTNFGGFGLLNLKLTNANGTLYFGAYDPPLGFTVWKSDGTSAGTILVKDLNPNPLVTQNDFFNDLFGAPSGFTNLNGSVLFSAYDPAVGVELWKTDGTTNGTVLVKDINPGGSSSPSNLLTVNGTLFFAAGDGNSGRELWKSDGTTGGTTLVKDISPGAASSSPENLTNVNGVLFFTANDGSTGTELWKSDGTAGGTVLVADIASGAASSSPGRLINVNGVLFFVASDGSSYGIWTSDGTPGGATLVSNVSPSSTFAILNGLLVFGAYDGAHGVELWSSDGTPGGTTLLGNLATDTNTAASSPSDLVDLHGVLLFSAYDGSHGTELWRSDGTDTGTTLVADINAGPNGSGPYSLTPAGGRVFFTADDGINDYELWQTDGSEAGTTLIKDVNPAGGSYPEMLTDVNGTLFFRADDGTNGYELWKSDGTETGTTLVKDINPAGDSYPDSLFKVNGTLFFSADDGINGGELWKSDGTDTGTVLVKDIATGPDGSWPYLLAAANNLAFFSACDAVTCGLWRSDGSDAGTFLLTEASPQSAVAIGGTLFFTAEDVDGGKLWRSDGTPGGTVVVTDVWAEDLTNVNGTLFFTAYDPQHGVELWNSDGTAAGTVMVRDIRPGPAGSNPSELTNVHGTLVFRACDALGCEVWRSDGTTAGTVRLADVLAGAGSSNPGWFTASGSHLFFAATTAATGNELWSLPLPTACGNGVIEAGEECDDGNLSDGDGCDSTCHAEGAEMFSNFGPADSYDSGNGRAAAWDAGGVHLQNTVAAAFMPSMSRPLGTIEAALNLLEGTNQVTLAIAPDDGGVPGVPLETIPLSGVLSSSPTIIAARSLLHPTLNAGTQYWLVVSVGASGSEVGWSNNSAGATGSVARQLGTCSTSAGACFGDFACPSGDVCQHTPPAPWFASNATSPAFRISADVCGNGVLDVGEDCDDGDTWNGNGCSDACTIEFGWDCSGEPSSCAMVPATWTVDSTLDEDDMNPGDGVCAGDPSGTCTLRAAISEALARGIGDTVALPPGVYALADNPLWISTGGGTLTIEGADPSTTIIEGAPFESVVLVDLESDVTIRGVTIQNGAESGVHNMDGIVTLEDCIVTGNSESGIRNSGTLSIQNCAITANGDAGIWNEDTGTLWVDNSSVTGNTGFEAGGIDNNGAATVVTSLISANVGDQAGGLFNGMGNDPVLEVFDSTVSDNIGNSGGGIDSNGALDVDGCTVSGNQAMSEGGGLSIGETATVINSTVSGNQAQYGGGISVANQATFPGAMLLNNVTVTDNSADDGGFGSGGGLSSGAAPDELVVRNTIIAGNSAADGGPDCEGDFVSEGYNLIGDSTDCTFSGDTTGHITGVAPNLGPLQDNGGPTFTHALLAGSPARDAADDFTCEFTDQRGIDRPQGAACDIGAFEAEQECGNTVVEPGETCDDGNTMDGDGCSAACQIEGCGGSLTGQWSASLGPVTIIDHGATVYIVIGPGYPIPASPFGHAALGFTRSGNTLVAPGQPPITIDTCDQLTLTAAPGQFLTFTRTATSACGDGTQDVGEQCDDGNLSNGDGCSIVCTVPACGDGFPDPGEQCDDGNPSDHDACKHDCTPNVCGDGVVRFGHERCDDGNLIDGDGCESNCTPTPKTFSVDSQTDEPDDSPGDGVCATGGATCTLRAAIEETNARQGRDTITLSAGSYDLTNGPLEVYSNVTVTGAGMDVTSIVGDGLNRVLTLAGDVTISGLTVRNGVVNGDCGGGVWNDGALALDHCRITSNITDDSGGGICNWGTLALNDCVVDANIANVSGGGIVNHGELVISTSTVSSNRAIGDPGSGGGIADDGTLTLMNSTISGNSAIGNGGGIYALGSVSLSNVTVAYNRCDSEGWGGGDGGGIFNEDASVTQLRNSIVAENADGSGEAADCGGPGSLDSAGHNLVQNTAGCTITGDTAGNITGVDPLLAPLASYGGPTETHALRSGSPAINAGNATAPGNGSGACEATDQRGTSRPQGAACDIGAVEGIADLGPAIYPVAPSASQRMWQGVQDQFVDDHGAACTGSVAVAISDSALCFAAADGHLKCAGKVGGSNHSAFTELGAANVDQILMSFDGSGNGDSVCVKKSDGTAACLGDQNGHGQFGNGNTAAASSFTQWGSQNNLTHLGTGTWDQMCAIDSGGVVRCSGLDFGLSPVTQDGGATHTHFWIDTTGALQLDDPDVFRAANGRTNCRVTTEGFWCPSNSFAGPPSAVVDGSLTSTLPEMLDDQDSCWLSTAGTVQCLRENIDPDSPDLGTRRLVSHFRNGTVLALAANSYTNSMCAVYSDGSLWCVGDNTEGKFGNGNTDPLGAETMVAPPGTVRIPSCNVCGNGTLEAGEQCDDGNTANGDGCNATCQMEPGCAGGMSGTWHFTIFNVPIQWNLIDDGPSGLHGSQFAIGLPFINPAPHGPIALTRTGSTLTSGGLTGTVVACDRVDFTGFSSFTMTRVSTHVCGNGTVEAGESCDDGNFSNDDACNIACTAAQCGNGSVEPGEQCDDGNTTNGDLCAANCHQGCNGSLTGVWSGGPGPLTIIDHGSTADVVIGPEYPHATVPFGRVAIPSTRSASTISAPGQPSFIIDSCNQLTLIFGTGQFLSYTRTSTAACGDGTQNPGEQCDDGNFTNGDGCSIACTAPVCGDGVSDPAEECDDGNTNQSDLCRNDCRLNRCGDGTQDPGEACDDGDLFEGDGCDSNCTVSACGNGIKSAGEQCDDGNAVNGDGCDANCTFTPVSVNTNANANQTVSTDPGTGASPAHPVVTSVTTPNAGSVSITQTSSTTSTTGFAVFGQQVTIQAPPATAAAPLVLTFRVDASEIPAGVDPLSFQMLRDDVPIADCSGAPGTAAPDPCVESRVVLGDGDLVITVLTSSTESSDGGGAAFDAEQPRASGPYSVWQVALPSFDSVVRPPVPLTVTFPARPGASSTLSRTVRVLVRNASKKASQDVLLVADRGDCPVGLITDVPDFDTRTAGALDHVTLRPGQIKVAAIPLLFDRAAFTSATSRTPARCTMRFTSQTLPAGSSVDPTPANNVATLELNVVDATDAQIPGVSESYVRSALPVALTIPSTKQSVQRRVPILVGNGTLAERAGHEITVTVNGGDCPSSIFDSFDLDLKAPLNQASAVVRGGALKAGMLPLTVDLNTFATPNRFAPARCTAEVTVSGAADGDAGNNTTKLVIDVTDLHDQ